MNVYITHIFFPLLSTGVGGSGETEGLVLLQRRLRDLDAAIDQVIVISILIPKKIQLYIYI